LKQISAPITSISQPMPGFFLVWLEAPEIADICKPGQFVMVGCGGGALLRRPFGIHQVNNQKVAILFQMKGAGTDWLSQRKSGDKLDILGPLGNGFSVKPESRHLLIIAGGIGVAPLTYLAQQALYEGRTVTMILGARTKETLYPGAFFSPQIEVAVTTDDGSSGFQGRVTDLLLRYVNPADQIFACGPLPMLIDMYQKRLMFQHKPVQVSLEVRMGCGLGICYGCSVKTTSGMKTVCKDGPVFDMEDINWDTVRC